jgi:beta-galactosidase
VLAYGFRAINLFMAVDRDRFYGAPIEPKRPRRHKSKVALGALDLLRTFREEEINALGLRAPVAIVLPRSYVTLTQATWVLGTLAPPVLQALGMEPSAGAAEDDFGFAQPIQIVWSEALHGLVEALSEHGVGCVIVDGECAKERLDALKPRVVVALTYEFIEQELWDVLTEWASQGKELVIGPRLPVLGADMVQLSRGVTREGACQEGLKVTDLGDRAARLELARAFADRPELRSPFWTEAEGVDVTVLLDSDGAPRVVGVVELDGRTRRVTIESIDEEVGLRELPDGGVVEGRSVELRGFEVRLLGVVRRAES